MGVWGPPLWFSILLKTQAVPHRGRFRTARAQRVHSARTAPVITVFTPVTALKTCHL